MQAIQNKTPGYTLIETLTVVAILVVIVSMAAPSFARTYQETKIKGITEGIVAALYEARAMASRDGKSVTVCARQANSVQCELSANKGNWNNGWLMFVDGDGDPSTFNKNTDVLERDHPASNKSQYYIVTNGVDLISKRITFKSRFGEAKETAGFLYLCMSPSIAPREVSVEFTGRIEATKKPGEYNALCG